MMMMKKSGISSISVLDQNSKKVDQSISNMCIHLCLACMQVNTTVLEGCSVCRSTLQQNPNLQKQRQQDTFSSVELSI